MKKFSRQILRINTKITDFEKIKAISQPVIDFANKHDVHLKITVNNEDQKLYSECAAEGRTSAYCKGMVAEVKDMIKAAFKCSVEVIFYAY